MQITVRAAPSLALMKYWGKRNVSKNIPDTTSIGITLSNWYVETTLYEKGSRDLSPEERGDRRMQEFFANFCTQYHLPPRYEIQVKSNMPYASGFAGSSAAFASLAYACSRILPRGGLSVRQLSSLARQGSASAARAVLGGFTILPAGGYFARPLWKAVHWPQLRILCVHVLSQEKSISSRRAMILSRSSPFYKPWLRDSRSMKKRFLEAIAEKDMEKLGHAMRQNTYCMFAVMLSSHPPVRYWEPGTMTVLSVLEELRKKGLGAWETMDAGPQVKILVEYDEVPSVVAAIQQALPKARIDTLQGADVSLVEL